MEGNAELVGGRADRRKQAYRYRTVEGAIARVKDARAKVFHGNPSGLRRGSPRRELLGGGDDACQIAELSLQNERRPVIAFVGMAFEARIAAGPGVLVLCRSAGHELCRGGAEAARMAIAAWSASALLAGSPPACVPAIGWSPPPSLTRKRPFHRCGLVGQALASSPGQRYAPIVGVDDPVAEPGNKRAASNDRRGRGRYGIACGRPARRRAGLAFAAVRVIVDPADRAIPPAALLGMGADGRTDVAGVLRELIARPAQLSHASPVSRRCFRRALRNAARAPVARSAFRPGRLGRAELGKRNLRPRIWRASDVAAYRSAA